MMEEKDKKIVALVLEDTEDGLTFHIVKPKDINTFELLGILKHAVNQLEVNMVRTSHFK